MSPKRAWVVLPDQLSARIFVDTGIVAGLRERLPDRLVLVPVGDGVGRPLGGDGVTALDVEALAPPEVPAAERVRRNVDRRLDRALGYHPLAIRLNLRHGFHRERMAAGH